MELLTEFIEWAWARHHNVLSWYIRPLFLLPFCYFAYKRNIWGIVITLIALMSSIFWFPAPDNPSPAVGLKYGTDSPEYEMVGGTRDSERKKPKPKQPPIP